MFVLKKVPLVLIATEMDIYIMREERGGKGRSAVRRKERRLTLLAHLYV